MRTSKQYKEDIKDIGYLLSLQTGRVYGIRGLNLETLRQVAYAYKLALRQEQEAVQA